MKVDPGYVLLAMMAAFLAAVVAVVVRGRRAPRTLSPLGRLGIGAGGLVVVFLAWTLTMHMCGAGLPARQWWLASLSWLLAAAFLAHPRPLALAFGLCLVGFLVLGFSCDAVVHRRDYTGSPKWATFTARPGEQVTVLSIWHTRLTGLYAVRRSGP
jgi:hypothetical protein